MALHASHVGDGDAGGEPRVLGVGLEGAAGQRRAGDADRGAEEDVDALGLGLGGQHLTHALDELGVPGGADGHAAGERERAPPGQALAAHSRGAVGHLEGRDAEALDGRDEPEAGARGEGGLLVEGQALQQVVDVDRVGRVGRVGHFLPPLCCYHAPSEGRRRPSTERNRGRPVRSRSCRSACWRPWPSAPTAGDLTRGRAAAVQRGVEGQAAGPVQSGSGMSKPTPVPQALRYETSCTGRRAATPHVPVG